MTETPSFAQLLKQAIENRLLEVHTALIARVESYDTHRQQVSVSPVLKRVIKATDGNIVQESLPMICDVPVLFPRAGGFFISLPIQVGDFVQVIFNETGIDEFVTEKSFGLDSVTRFTLQGAVAIPGMFRESSPLQDAHEANLVVGKDRGVQIHIDAEKIRLGSADASEALAVASKVKGELEKLKNAINAHTHASFGAPPTPIRPAQPIGIVGPVADIATQKVMAS